jgi:hypothetical protein
MSFKDEVCEKVVAFGVRPSRLRHGAAGVSPVDFALQQL